MVVHTHPESASIRELTAVKDALLQEMGAMEGRLAKKIDEAFHVHAQEHAEIAAHATVRHNTIDDFMSKFHHAEDVAVGRSQALGWGISLLRAINEFRWLIAVIIAALAFMLGDLEITLGPHP